jgi:hypothetical protein
MNKARKLAYGIILGGVLWITGTYTLFMVFGDSKLIGLFVLIGWLVLVAYILKYLTLLKKDKTQKKL